MTNDIKKIMEDFEFFESWEDKYSYIIELGNSLEEIDQSRKTEENKVLGCVSQVWLISERREGRFYFYGSSDAFIVKGLLVIIFAAFSGKTKEEILEKDFELIFAKLDLSSHLSKSRSNGVYSVVKRIKHIAESENN